MNTFEITKQLAEIRAVAELEQFDEETGELIDNSAELKESLDALGAKRDTKLKGIEYIKREYISINSTIDDEIKRLKERKAKFVKKVDSLSGLQEYLLGGEKVETDLFTFSFRKSTSVNVDDVELATLKGKFVDEKTTWTIKKAEIKKAIKDGEVVEGAYLEDKYNLQVK